MFHQMLYFLTLKDDVNADATENLKNQVSDKPLFPSLLGEDEVQSVIFDE